MKSEQTIKRLFDAAVTGAREHWQKYRDESEDVTRIVLFATGYSRWIGKALAYGTALGLSVQEIYAEVTGK